MASSRRASESNVRPRKKFESAGAVTETATVNSAMTRMSSIKVKPKALAAGLLLTPRFSGVLMRAAFACIP
jgi:hypothetical protein